MSNKSSSSKSQEGYYAFYKSSSRWKTNRTRKLEQLLKLHPNNNQIRLALKSIVYRRKTPITPFWSHSMILEAKLFKLFVGSVPKDIFNSNEKIRESARLHARREHYGILPQGRVDFSLGSRAMNPAASTT